MFLWVTHPQNKSGFIFTMFWFNWLHYYYVWLLHECLRDHVMLCNVFSAFCDAAMCWREITDAFQESSSKQVTCFFTPWTTSTVISWWRTPQEPSHSVVFYRRTWLPQCMAGLCMENAELKDSISSTVLVVKDKRDLFRKCLIYIWGERMKAAMKEKS